MKNDLISRQKAVEALENTECELLQEEWDKLTDAILDVPSTQSWIPCSERLPEEKGYYLTTTTYQVVYCDYWNGEHFDRTEMVIAWMPMPAPWKEENDG